jgi:PE family protein
MSFVFATPELLTAAATDLAGIGSTIDAATAAAAGQTTRVVAAGADQVSAAVAALFSGHGQAYQAASAQVAAVHQGLVQNLSASAASYVGAEAQNLLGLANNGTANVGGTGGWGFLRL